MREIKFRAWSNWHTHGFQMIFSDQYGLTFDGMPVFLDWGGGVDELDETILMQYTGLKDKNGREIYEGDIVTHQENIKVIVWDKVNACFDWDEIRGWGDNFTGFVDEYEVIGNIYENPELIK